MSSICVQFWKEYAKDLIFSEIFFTKRDLTRYFCFINIYIAYQNSSFILVKF